MTAMLSTPVCGVDRRNAVVAPLLLSGTVPVERCSHRNHTARAQWKRHPEEARLEDLAEAVATEVTLDPLRRDHHRQQPGDEEAEQQVWRHGAEHSPRRGGEGQNPVHHLLSL